MPASDNDDLQHAVLTLMRPLARVLLRYGVSFQSFAELAKRAYVDVARSDFAIEGRKPSDSRVAVITGLTRKEVLRLKRAAADPGRDTAARHNRAARVISGWLTDPDFKDRRGRPAPLPMEDAAPCFHELVRKHGGDVPARAVADELERVGAVRLLTDGRISLVARGYVPARGEADKLHVLGTDVGDLITTIDHNLTHSPPGARYQRKVAYDNLPGSALAPLRTLAARDAQRLLEKLNRWLAERDRDHQGNAPDRDRHRAGLAIYYFEEQVDAQPSEDD